MTAMCSMTSNIMMRRWSGRVGMSSNLFGRGEGTRDPVGSGECATLYMRRVGAGNGCMAPAFRQDGMEHLHAGSGAASMVPDRYVGRQGEMPWNGVKQAKNRGLKRPSVHGASKIEHFCHSMRALRLLFSGCVRDRTSGGSHPFLAHRCAEEL